MHIMQKKENVHLYMLFHVLRFHLVMPSSALLVLVLGGLGRVAAKAQASNFLLSVTLSSWT